MFESGQLVKIKKRTFVGEKPESWFFYINVPLDTGGPPIFMAEDAMTRCLMLVISTIRSSVLSRDSHTIIVLHPFLGTIGVVDDELVSP